ncbi:MAG: LPS-assembly protein LptD [Acetobacteraceae bacterium]|nr:LPS-assembly protein LptD [Acetobacteraceae bacterium]
MAGLLVLPGAARAQLGQLSQFGGQHPVTSGEPVTFIADQVEYDRELGILTATGHVEAWQGDRVLRADKITFDRNTNIMAASGNVVLLEPTGQVLFSDYAELTGDMKEGVLRDLRAILAENARLAANGARRTGGVINEFSRVVYSTCNLCKEDPNRPPLWQIRALSAVQDTEHKRIEYQDAELEMFGVPVAYFPYFEHADPSVKRASGLLIPTIGTSSHIGAFLGVPYYLVIDDQSDATFVPLVATKQGPELSLEYRRRFNDGTMTIDGSLAYDEGHAQASIDARGRFSLNDTWRYGFDIERASSADYVRDFQLGRYLGGTPNLLNSQIYLEGFGEGAYARLDSRFYQSLITSIAQSELPVVLPRYEYSYFGQVDPLGGRLSADLMSFNVLRPVGTNTRRAGLTLNWERPFTGYLGDLWQITLHSDSALYNATQTNEQPNFFTHNSVSDGRAFPQAALDFRWPFLRDSGSWGTQIIEPRAQVVTAPNAGDSQFNKYPNEDSFDFQLTDMTLFGFNRFSGIDRLQGGTRVNYAMHGAWYLNGVALDGLAGQSYQTEVNPLFPFGSGLNRHLSDYVGRVTFTPTNWFDLTYRWRLDQSSLKTRLADIIAAAGVPRFHMSLGYIYTTFNPYTLYAQPYPPPVGSGFYMPRDEITLGAGTSFGHYRLNTFARRDLTHNQMVFLGADGAYEDECYIFDIKFYRRYTSVEYDHGSTTLLFQMTFKTVGQFGFHAM